MSYIGSNYTQQLTTPAVDYFNGNGVTTTFQLTRAVTSVNAIQVVVNNVPQNAREAYGINASNQIVFTSAPSAGTNNIYVIYDSQVGQFVTPSPGTVTASALVSGSVGQSALDVSLAGGTGALLAPAGTTAFRPANSVTGMLRFNATTAKFEGFTGSVWSTIDSFRLTATGGQIIDSGTHRYHVFTQSGTFAVTEGTASADILIVAGGGSATGGDYSTGSGGGGAGGIVSTSVTLVVGSYSVTVGAGGLGGIGNNVGNNGGNSSISGLGLTTAVGGGRGAAYSGYSANVGGSGGGGGYSPTAGAAGTAGQGNAGGSGSTNRTGGGGGGFSAVGGNATVEFSGNGGDGGYFPNFAIAGFPAGYYGGGGGGGSSDWTDPPAAGRKAGKGGLGGGKGGYSIGQQYAVAGEDGRPNTGGGGGGTAANGSTASATAVPNASGGSGIVIIRYLK